MTGPTRGAARQLPGRGRLPSAPVLGAGCWAAKPCRSGGGVPVGQSSPVWQIRRPVANRAWSRPSASSEKRRRRHSSERGGGKGRRGRMKAIFPTSPSVRWGGNRTEKRAEKRAAWAVGSNFFSPQMDLGHVPLNLRPLELKL